MLNAVVSEGYEAGVDEEYLSLDLSDEETPVISEGEEESEDEDDRLADMRRFASVVISPEEVKRRRLLERR